MSWGIDISCQEVKGAENGLFWRDFSVVVGFFGAESR